jgi:hypothetical protein
MKMCWCRPSYREYHDKCVRHPITWRAYPAVAETKSNFVAQGQEGGIPRNLHYKTIGVFLHYGENYFFEASTREVCYEFRCVIIQI